MAYRLLISLVALSIVALAHGEEKLKFQFQNKDIKEVLKDYSKKTGAQVIFSNRIKGHVNILTDKELSNEEAFAALSSALKEVGYAITLQNGIYIVDSARSTLRGHIEIVDGEVPPLSPERLVTLIYRFKNIDGAKAVKNMRTFVSRDGEMALSPDAKSILITDWVSSLHRVARILKAVDVK